MITGEVTPDQEAVIPLTLRGPGPDELDTEAVLDTGFTGFLLVPPAVAASLQLVFREVSTFALADGTTTDLDLYEVTVVWEGQPRAVLAIVGDSDPLVGISLLHGSRVTLEVVDGGPITLEPLGGPQP